MARKVKPVPVCDEDKVEYYNYLLDMDSSVHDLIESIKDGEQEWDNLKTGEKMAIIKYYLDEGTYTIQDIAKEMGVSPKTIQKYRAMVAGVEKEDLEAGGTWKVAMEVYRKYKAAYRLAMKKGQPKAAGYILTNMVSTLQSLGILYKAPTRRQVQAAIRQHTVHSKDPGSYKDYQSFRKALTGKEDKYVLVLEELLNAVETNKIDDKNKDVIDITKKGENNG